MRPPGNRTQDLPYKCKTAHGAAYKRCDWPLHHGRLFLRGWQDIITNWQNVLIPRSKQHVSISTCVVFCQLVINLLSTLSTVYQLFINLLSTFYQLLSTFYHTVCHQSVLSAWPLRVQLLPSMVAATTKGYGCTWKDKQCISDGGTDAKTSHYCWLVRLGNPSKEFQSGVVVLFCG